MLKFASLFSGIGGWDLGLENAGIRACFQCEQDGTARAVLENHWRHIQGTTDVTDAFTTESLCRIKPDGITAGWPCQGNSVAGRRAGMADERSGLWGEVVRILAAVRPRWFLGENVPGILSVNGGLDWLTVLRDLAELGYGTAYRILDAQWFGLAQRRRRVFIVGCLGDWRRAAEVLFESESLPWDSAPSREAGARVAASLTRGTSASRGVNPPGRRQEDDVNLTIGTLDCTPGGVHRPVYSGGGVTRSLNSSGSEVGHVIAANNFGVHDVARCLSTSNERIDGDTETFVAHSSSTPIGFSKASDPNNWIEDGMPPLTLRNGDCGNVSGKTGVRRLTPVECERLQGFPDDFTRYRDDGTELSDSARYRMLGNAVAVPCAEWIGRRIMEANQ